jgi:hypothetical protein
MVKTRHINFQAIYTQETERNIAMCFYVKENQSVQLVRKITPKVVDRTIFLVT